MYTNDYTEIMRDGQKLTLEQLRDECREAVYKSRLKHREVADKLGVTTATVSAALNYAQNRYVKMQTRIIEELTNYLLEVDRTVVYTITARRKDEEGKNG